MKNRMPALIGGFGKIDKNTINKQKVFSKKSNLSNFVEKNNTSKEDESIECTKSKIGPYLAGLIEADGSIAVHNKDSKAKKYNPKIIVVFSLADKPLADKLVSITNAGVVFSKENAGHVIWQIQKKEDVLKIVNLINGYMRTPKIEALHRAIIWFNEFYNCKIDCLALDLSPIDSNAWLAGFTDGDGNFSINLINRKKKGNITSKRVQTFFRIELRQNYHRDVSVEQGGTSYFSILSKIANYLGVNLYSRTR